MLENLPKFVFFTGKGGVGKTSLACATALMLTDVGKRVLLVSTDPASNVGQVFETSIGNRITAIPGAAGLDALEIDPEAAAAQYRERIVGPMRGTLPEKVLRSIEEQLSGGCTTEIAAFDEFTGLLTDEALGQRHDHIVFDTAPTGHTLRLLKLPGAWSAFLGEVKGDASCLGPLAGLEKQRTRYAQAVERLADGSSTRLIFVARPRESALAEAARTARELADIGIRNQQLAVNGVMPQVTSGDALAEALHRKDQVALNGMAMALAALPRAVFALQPVNLVGIDALRRFARPQIDTSLATVPHGTHAAGPRAFPSFGDLVDALERPGKGLIMLMGKGGVGKTTMAAAIAAELAARGHDVHLTTTDPAAHLTETLSGELERLTVSRIDPALETRRYRDEVLASKGQGLDAGAHALLEEDLRSPCTEEIAVFQAFSGVIRESSRRFVVMDTAPTGHTLLLLDAAGAYHRDVLRHAGENAARLVTPLMQLQDPEQTRILVVTLPEVTPVLEATKLQEDLKRAGIQPWGWIVNASLAAARTHDPLLQRRAQDEVGQIERVRTGLAQRFAVVPMQAEEPVGAARLRGLVQAADCGPRGRVRQGVSA